MKAVKTFAIGTIGAAALFGGAAPAAAQYYPGYGGNQPANVIGQVLQSVLNPYGQQQQYGYRMNPQMAVQQCTHAVQARLGQQYRAGYGQGYGYGYNNAYSNARVLGVTRIEQRSSSTLRVRGQASSGMAYAQPQRYGYGYGAQGYGHNPYAQQAMADLTFKCDIDSRGRIRDIDINRR